MRRPLCLAISNASARRFLSSGVPKFNIELPSRFPDQDIQCKIIRMTRGSIDLDLAPRPQNELPVLWAFQNLESLLNNREIPPGASPPKASPLGEKAQERYKAKCDVLIHPSGLVMDKHEKTHGVQK